MSARPVELRCSRDLAMRLGAVTPVNGSHFRELAAAGHLLVRDTALGWPMFWAPVPAEAPARAATARSS